MNSLEERLGRDSRMSSTTGFESAVLEVEDAAEANELFQRNGWTDGLPVVPPTEDAVARFLAAARLAPSDIIGVEPVRRRSIIAEKVAIASVMAGSAAMSAFVTTSSTLRHTCAARSSPSSSTTRAPSSATSARARQPPSSASTRRRPSAGA